MLWRLRRRLGRERVREQVQRTGCRADLGGGYAQIARGGCKAAMAQEKLDSAQIGSGFKQVNRERVPQRMR